MSNKIKRLQKTRNIEKERKKNPSGYKFEKHTLPPAPLKESESNLITHILLDSPGVTYTPRNRSISRSNGIEPHKWEIFGFDSYNHYLGWLDFNLRDKEKYEILDGKFNAKTYSNY